MTRNTISQTKSADQKSQNFAVEYSPNLAVKTLQPERCYKDFFYLEGFKNCRTFHLTIETNISKMLTKTKSQIFVFIDETDEEYSKILFAASIPYHVELLFSVPANWFGLSPILLVGPLWTALLLGPQFAEEWNVKLLAAAILLTIPLLIAWGSFLIMGNIALVKKVFVGIEVMTLFPLVSIGICSYLIENPSLFSASVYPLWLWMSSMIVILYAKRIALRTRPCIKAKFAKFIENKHFQVLPHALGKLSGNESFPSGDAAGGMAFGLSIALSGRPDVGLMIVFLVGAGRIYFLAHHVLDTLMGIIITLILHLLSGLLGLSHARMSWGAPLVMHFCFLVAFVCYAKTKQRSHEIDQSYLSQVNNQVNTPSHPS